MQRIMAAITDVVQGDMDSKVERDLRAVVYAWLAFTFELCRQRVLDPSIDAEHLADSGAHALLDAIVRVPGIPSVLTEAAGRR
jgi:hypothetical protein